jgi:hypothetical protein
MPVHWARQVLRASFSQLVISVRTLDQIDIAAETATHVLELASRADSARADERLRHLARLLRGYNDVQAAEGFLDQY